MLVGLINKHQYGCLVLGFVLVLLGLWVFWGVFLWFLGGLLGLFGFGFGVLFGFFLVLLFYLQWEQMGFSS